MCCRLDMHGPRKEWGADSCFCYSRCSITNGLRACDAKCCTRCVPIVRERLRYSAPINTSPVTWASTPTPMPSNEIVFISRVRRDDAPKLTSGHHHHNPPSTLRCLLVVCYTWQSQSRIGKRRAPINQCTYLRRTCWGQRAFIEATCVTLTQCAHNWDLFAMEAIQKFSSTPTGTELMFEWRTRVSRTVWFETGGFIHQRYTATFAAAKHATYTYAGCKRIRTTQKSIGQNLIPVMRSGGCLG